MVLVKRIVLMSNQMKLFALSIAFMASNPIFATELTNTQIQQTGKTDSSIEASNLSATDLAQAHIWDLSEAEWNRYKTLMQGIRGSVSPETISPIEVLGIHARDNAERQRYAKIWARAMREDVGRILAFQHAYDAAGKRLYPDTPLIDTSQLPVKEAEISVFQSTDRILFFARPDCPACDMLLSRLLKRLDEVAGLDIYLLGIASNDDAVRDWASSHQIRPEWVRTRRVTLNHDADALDRLTSGKGNVPYLLRRRGTDLSELRASDL